MKPQGKIQNGVRTYAGTDINRMSKKTISRMQKTHWNRFIWFWSKLIRQMFLKTKWPKSTWKQPCQLVQDFDEYGSPSVEIIALQELQTRQWSDHLVLWWFINLNVHPLSRQWFSFIFLINSIFSLLICMVSIWAWLKYICENRNKFEIVSKYTVYWISHEYLHDIIYKRFTDEAYLQMFVCSTKLTEF